MLIPVDRQQDVLDVFWVLLRSCEQNTKTGCDMSDVEGGFRLMRDLDFTTAHPYWVKNKQD